MPQDDPTELFDLCSADGVPLGRAKPRALVHRDGDWHRSVHVWVVLDGPDGPKVLFQRRSLTKDTHPGKVDVSAAGHLRSGESTEDALREVDEEIGLAASAADTVRLGTRRRSDQRPGVIDREIQDVFLVRTTRPLASFRPDPDEVSALLAIRLTDACALVQGDVTRAEGEELQETGGSVERVTLERDELLPHGDGYFARALDAIGRRLVGVGAEAWRLGFGGVDAG